MRRILLDTNAYSHFLKGDEKVARAITSAGIIYLSVFVTGELLAGFRKGSKEQINKSLLSRFINKPSVDFLVAGYETAEIFSELKSNLMTAGSPIPINDVWIASHAIETGSVLVTYDQHFKKVPGLRIWEHLV